LLNFSHDTVIATVLNIYEIYSMLSPTFHLYSLLSSS